MAFAEVAITGHSQSTKHSELEFECFEFRDSGLKPLRKNK